MTGLSLRARLRLYVEQLEDRLVPSIDLTAVEWRTIDGTNNNIALPTQGAAETQQIRFGYGQRFPDGFGDTIITTPQRANPRSISNALHAQSGSVPNSRHLTDWVFQWGQWITHDMDLTRNGPEWNTLSTGAVGDFSIPILDPNDPLGPNPIPFNRSQIVPGTGVPGQRREVVNSITSYIDASMVYGSDPVRAEALRTKIGGKLKTSANGQLLPLNTPGLPNADQFGMGNQLFLAGDIRANEQVNLTVVHTLFVREHNRLATRIAQLNPGFSDEQIYQLARRIVGAEMQKITYEEYLPAVFGFDLAPNPNNAIYNPNVNASITNSFAHAVFRFGHSQINETTLLVNNLNQTTGALSVRDAFFNPNFLKSDPNNVGKMLKGLASQLGQENDLLLVDGVRNFLFGPPAGGLDLAALDIQRSRDHGLPDYNALRNSYGIPRVTSFAEITSNVAIQQKLQEVFGTVDNIDAFVGALAEDHLPGSSVGPFIKALVGNQFERLRDGDRFFYTNDAFLQSAGAKQIIDLNAVTLSQIIRWNTNITNIQDTVFFDRSVIVFEAPQAGSNISLVAGLGLVSIVDNRTGQIHALNTLGNISQVILVGSNTSADYFNLFIAAANGGLEDGVQVYGRNSTGDTMNVYGTPFNDAFTVGTRTASVNGNTIEHTGLERIRLVTLGGNDSTQISSDMASIASVLLWHNPLDEN